MNTGTLEKRIRFLILFFMGALTVSGLTAIPLVSEITILKNTFGGGTWFAGNWPALGEWIDLVHRGITDTAQNYPFMFYGTDWLAFAHVVIAIAFIGPFKDPVKNRWVIEFGIIACILIVPWVFVFAGIRELPFFWKLIDWSFGILGIIPLWLARKYTLLLEQIKQP